jgi:3-oxoacyl-[acyl-carrier protein] reductase
LHLVNAEGFKKGPDNTLVRDKEVMMIDLLDFSNRSVLVVGGSSGIGNGIAQTFRSRGATVHIWGTRATATDYSAEPDTSLNGLHYACVDVTDAEAIGRSGSFHKLDVLVLSQGTVAFSRAEFEQREWSRVNSVNLDSVMLCAMHFRDSLAAAGGSLIIISSISGFKANIANPAYAASKAAAISLTRTLGAAWAKDGIRVNGIAPGLVRTKLTRVVTESPRRLERVLANIPLGRAASPEEIGTAALFLASSLASYIVGQTLVVDGGRLLV